MASSRLAYISGAVSLRPGVKSETVRVALRDEFLDDDGGLVQELKSRFVRFFVDACNSDLRDVQSEVPASFLSLKVGEVLPQMEFHKDWLRIDCDIVADAGEADSVLKYLSESIVYALLSVQFEVSLAAFRDRVLPKSLFDEVSCSFYCLTNPEEVEEEEAEPGATDNPGDAQ